MPTLVIKGKITKGYDHWVKVYDEAEELRNKKYDIRTIYRGYEVEAPTTIHVVMYTPNMEVLQQHMENEADLIAAAGGDPSPEANIIVMCSD
jgi:hypothetical protein